MELLSRGLGIGGAAWATITHMLTKNVPCVEKQEDCCLPNFSFCL